MHDTRSVLLNFVPFSGATTGVTNTTADSNFIDMDFYADFSGMIMRRTWYQKDAFNKKFFLNAKGRYDNYLTSPENRIYRIDNSRLIVVSKNERPSGNEDDFSDGATAITQDDLLLRSVLDYIGNKKLRYKDQGDYSSEIMIRIEFDPNNTTVYQDLEGELNPWLSLDESGMEDEVGYIFDLELNQFTKTIQIGELTAYPFQISGTFFRQDSPYYEYNGEYVDISENIAFKCKNISLYAKKSR